jgi:hypothetical protein
MKNLKKLNNFKDNSSFNLIVGLAIEWSFNILIDLYLHLLLNPSFLSPLQQMNIQRIGHPQTILYANRPYFTSHFFGDEFLDETNWLLFKFMSFVLKFIVLFIDFIPILN